MNWINKLQRKYGRYKIDNLMIYIIGMTGAMYILMHFFPEMNILGKIALHPGLILHGEVWRLITFIFIPPLTSPLFFAFALYFYYLVGTGLEEEWGTFKFNLYYLFGILGTIIGSFITVSPVYSAFYLNISLFLAFARIYPNFQILLFFIIPVKVKYIALFNWVLFAITILFNPMGDKIAVIAALVNYYIFFGKDILENVKNRNRVTKNRRKFGYQKSDQKGPFHRCTVCGITDQDDPYMDFRYCVECNGHYGYCKEHLHNHEHIK